MSADTTGRGRPRVAFLSTWHPEPADNGRKQRTRLMIDALAKSCEIVLVSMLSPGVIAQGPLPIVPGVAEQLALPLPTFSPRSPAALLAGAHPLPRSTVATWSPRTARDLRDVLARLDVDLTIGTDLRTLRYLLALPGNMATILDEPDVSPFLVERGAGAGGRSGMRQRLREWKYRRLLRAATARLGAVLVASEIEATAYRALSGADGVLVLENGVAELPVLAWSPPRSTRLIFPGSITYAPNLEAAAHFARRIFPHIQARVPDVEFIVTGDLPDVVPPELRHPQISLTGVLPFTEFDSLRRQARACVVPLLSGTGTRVKILEAMALGMPVVTTSKGAEGLAVSPGEDILLADDPDDFAAAVTTLLLDDHAAETLGQRARAHAAARFTWDAMGATLRAIVLNQLQRPEIARVR